MWVIVHLLVLVHCRVDAKVRNRKDFPDTGQFQSFSYLPVVEYANEVGQGKHFVIVAVITLFELLLIRFVR